MWHIYPYFNADKVGCYSSRQYSPPEVTNVVTQQVEISHDLLGRNGDLMTVSWLVSSDGAAAFIWKPKA